MLKTTPHTVQPDLEGVTERLERDVVSVASAAGHPSSVLVHVHASATALQQRTAVAAGRPAGVFALNFMYSWRLGCLHSARRRRFDILTMSSETGGKTKHGSSIGRHGIEWPAQPSKQRCGAQPWHRRRLLRRQGTNRAGKKRKEGNCGVVYLPLLPRDGRRVEHEVLEGVLVLGDTVQGQEPAGCTGVSTSTSTNTRPKRVTRGV